MKLGTAYPYWSKGPTKTDRMLVQHTLPWHGTGFVLLAFTSECSAEGKERFGFQGS